MKFDFASSLLLGFALFLAGCGGGGGSSGGDSSGGGNGGDDSPSAPQYADIPLFLQNASLNCQYYVGSSELKIDKFSGDLQQVTRLECTGTGFYDLSGIESLASLKELVLIHGRLRNLSGLESLTALVYLDLSDNQILDLAPLQSLTLLETLNLSANQIMDLSHLQELTNLMSVDVSGNSQINCTNLMMLSAVLNPEATVKAPSKCEKSLSISSASPQITLIDDSVAGQDYQRVVIEENVSISRLKLIREEDSLLLEISYSDEAKVVQLVDWFLDSDHSLQSVELVGSRTYTIDELLAQIGLEQLLTDEDESFTGSDGKDLVYGLAGQDKIYGGEGNDVLFGNDNEDVLAGDAGDDKLVGGGAQVSFYGYVNNFTADNARDTYRFAAGDGNDTIYEFENDRQFLGLLQLTGEISAGDIELRMSVNDLIFYLDDKNSIRLHNWRANYRNRLAELQFGDDMPVAMMDWVMQRSISIQSTYSGQINGSIANDAIVGSPYRDWVFGYGGSDVIDGGAGDDVLAGNSVTFFVDPELGTVFGGDGAVDTYVYRTGYGRDTIYEDDPGHAGVLKFGPGITEEDFTLYRDHSEDSLVFKFDDQNSVTLFRWFKRDVGSVEMLQFDAQTPIDLTQWVNAYDKEVTLQGEGTILGSLGRDTIIGSDQDDRIDGDAQDDQLYGGSGNDILIGGMGTNYISGGKGNDWIVPGIATLTDGIWVADGLNNASNTIFFEKGDGVDTIVEWFQIRYGRPNNSTLKFAADISPEDITLHLDGNDLVLAMDAGDSVILREWYTNTAALGYVQFGDLPPLVAPQWFNTKANRVEGSGELHGAVGPDQIVGEAQADKLMGHDGEDDLSGAGGDDVLVGGSDADIIRGGAGGDTLIGGNATLSNNPDGSIKAVLTPDGAIDTYVYSLGDGHDLLMEYEIQDAYRGLLHLQGDITSEMVGLVGDGHNLILRFDSANSITLFEWFSYSPTNYRIGSIQFADDLPVAMMDWLADKSVYFRQVGNNSIVNLNTPSNIVGDDSNQFIYGGDASDHIDAGRGDDYVQSSGGDDYVYGGEGNDLINGSGGEDTLIGGPGDDVLAGSWVIHTFNSTTGQYSISRVGDGDNEVDTYIFNLGDGHDQIYDNETDNLYKGILKFGSDITEAMVVPVLEGNDLVLQIDENNEVRWRNWRTYIVEQITANVSITTIHFGLGKIQFGDGAPIDAMTWLGAKPLLVAVGTPNGTDLPERYQGNSADSEVNMLGGDDTVDGGEGNETIRGGNGSDYLLGGPGNDRISGGSGVDRIVGGPGDDVLTGYSLPANMNSSFASYFGDGAEDVFEFNVGDGNDTIVEYESHIAARGLLKLGAGIEEANTVLVKDGSNLIISFGNGDSVTLFRWYYALWEDGQKYDYHKLGRIQFHGTEPVDAATWIASKPLSQGPVNNITGTDAADELNGTSAGDYIYGLNGADILVGFGGADELAGGAGDDKLVGGEATVTDGVISGWTRDGSIDYYIYSVGDGHDTIYEYETSFSTKGLLKFEAGIAADNIVLQRAGNHLIFSIDASNSVTIYNWYASTNFQLGNIQFDGAEPIKAVDWVLEKGHTVLYLNESYRTINGNIYNNILVGGDSADTISGLGGDDDLIGGPGADTLIGGPDEDYLFGGGATVSGDTISWTNSEAYRDNSVDVYVYNLGDGVDYIVDMDNPGYGGILKFGTGISQTSFQVYRGNQTSNDLIFRFDGYSRVTVEDWFLGNSIQTIQFGNSAPIDADEFVNSVLIGTIPLSME